MIWIKNKRIPTEGFKCITFWPVVFYKGDKPDETFENHENIHGAQQKEIMLLSTLVWMILNIVCDLSSWFLLIPILLFYIIYCIEYSMKGYGRISFEKEAYDNQNDYNYLRSRKLFAMWRNLNK